MPYNHCENRRHKFTKPKYKVTNWPEYNDAECGHQIRWADIQVS